MSGKVARGGEPIRAAGCMLWRRTDGGIEVALVHRERHDDWSWPKGKLEGSESFPAAAVREVREETGYAVRLGRPLPTQHYPVEGIPKVVQYWAAEVDPEVDPLETHQEVDAMAWLRPAEASERLSYHHDRNVLEAFLVAPARTDTLVLLRHAKAMKRSLWHGADSDRPLEERGELEAGALLPTLAAYGVDRIHSSDALRCLRTVQPYAEAAGVTVEHEPLLSEQGFEEHQEKGLRRAQALSKEPGSVLLCTHRPVLHHVAPHLLGDVDEIDRGALAPAAAYVIHRHRGDPVSVERLAAPQHAPA